MIFWVKFQPKTANKRRSKSENTEFCILLATKKNRIRRQKVVRLQGQPVQNKSYKDCCILVYRAQDNNSWLLRRLSKPAKSNILMRVATNVATEV